MKKVLLSLCFLAFLSGCSSDDPVKLDSIKMSESSCIIYYDSELPTLTVSFTPENADNKDLEWSSSRPELIDVDASGKLTLKKFSYETVVITATNKANGVSAQCSLTMGVKKANLADYSVIELKDKLGFDMLDRNLGATKAYDPDASDDENKAAIGDYYQFGNSIPVATAAGVNSYYDKESNGGDLDWSKAENTPCPDGWRIPSMEEMKKLTDAAWADYDGISDQTDDEFYAAKALYKSLKLQASGYYKIDGDDKAARTAKSPYIYIPKSRFLWTSDLNNDKGSSSRGFKYVYFLSDNYDIMTGKDAEANAAMPIRCIK